MLIILSYTIQYGRKTRIVFKRNIAYIHVLIHCKQCYSPKKSFLDKLFAAKTAQIDNVPLLFMYY